MPHLNIQTLIDYLLETYDTLQLLMIDTKNHTHEDTLRNELERLEKLIKQLEKLL